MKYHHDQQMNKANTNVNAKLHSEKSERSQCCMKKYKQQSKAGTGENATPQGSTFGC